MQSSRWRRGPAHLALACLLVVAAPCAVRAAGQLDPEFAGGTGLASFQLGSGERPNDHAFAVMVDSNDRILVGGYRSSGPAEDVQRDAVVLRLLDNGSLDPAFGTGGVSIIDFDLGGALESALAVFETGDGGYLVCGGAQDASGGPIGYSRFATARLLADGDLDPGYSGDGKFDFALLPDSLEHNLPAGCARAPDGSLVVVGTALDDGEVFGEMVLARVLADASLDPDFGDGGIAHLPLPDGELADAVPNSVGIDAQGRIVIVGYARNLLAPDEPNSDMLAARFLADGSLDPDFGNGGIHSIAFDTGGGNNDIAIGQALLDDGSMLIAGLASTAADGIDMAVVRLIENGSLDPAFGDNGRALHGLAPGTGASETAIGVAIDARGRVHLAGRATAGAQDLDGAVLRLLASGAIDSAFGIDGWRLFGLEPPPENSFDSVVSITLDRRQRVLAAGALLVDPASEDFDTMVARLTTDLVFYDGFESPD